MALHKILISCNYRYFIICFIFVTPQEEVVTITMNKYRKGQQMLEEAEHRADMAEKSFAARGRGRSMSVTREITKVVRV